MEELGKTQPKKSLLQQMKNKFTRKTHSVNQKPKKSLRQKFTNLFTRKKVAPLPSKINKLTENIRKRNRKYENNYMNYATNTPFTTNASNPDVEQQIQKELNNSHKRYLENHPRTGFTSPFARKSRKSNK